jgi:hypothetical protein
MKGEKNPIKLLPILNKSTELSHLNISFLFKGENRKYIPNIHFKNVPLVTGAMDHTCNPSYLGA